jgi:hypothetical protein
MVVEATDSKVIAEKGTERSEFDTDPATLQGSAELKVGWAVAVTFVMSATKNRIESDESDTRTSISPGGRGR